jgi:hypothetical protein
MTFDPTFDYTFQTPLAPVGPVQIPDCRVEGVHVMWLAKYGWAEYTFRGNTDTDKDVRSPGTFMADDLEQDTVRIGRQIQIIRAGSLTKEDAAVLLGITTSPKVVVLAPNRAGRILAIPVRIEPGSFNQWRDNQKRINIEIKILFPELQFQPA